MKLLGSPSKHSCMLYLCVLISVENWCNWYAIQTQNLFDFLISQSDKKKKSKREKNDNYFLIV